MKAAANTERICVIVTESVTGGDKIFMGITVDLVSEVLNIKAGGIEDAPNFGSRLDAAYILASFSSDTSFFSMTYPSVDLIRYCTLACSSMSAQSPILSSFFNSPCF